MQQFWMGFEDRLEKTAGVGSLLGQVAGKASNAARGLGTGLSTLKKSIASTPQRTVDAFKEGLHSAPDAVKKPLTGVRRDVNKLLTGGLIGAGGAYVATRGNEQRSPY
jgi:hypothetical protein